MEEVDALESFPITAIIVVAITIVLIYVFAVTSIFDRVRIRTLARFVTRGPFLVYPQSMRRAEPDRDLQSVVQ